MSKRSRARLHFGARFLIVDILRGAFIVITILFHALSHRSLALLSFYISARKVEFFFKKARDTFTYHPSNKIKMIITSSEELIMKSQLKTWNYLREIDDYLTCYTL